MRRSRFDPARQRPDRSFEWQSGTRTGPDIFVSSCETYWRNGWVLGGDLVQLNRILEIKTELRLIRGLRTCHSNPNARSRSRSNVAPSVTNPGTSQSSVYQTLVRDHS